MKRIYLTLKNFYTCRGMKKCIETITKKCQICAKTKTTTRTFGYSQGCLYSDTPFEYISSDIFGLLKSIHFKTNNKNTYFYLITFTDIFSRLTETYYLKNITSNSVKNALKNWCLKYGYPKKFLSDQGRQFISSKQKKILDRHKIKHVITSAIIPHVTGFLRE
ncbi:Gypsy retrotransposon integrase-like protein 1 [Dictyocoela muelleri]|nr:Gypsy retrotransposon integrase-like protein 1 [Dictyocoela muelleri]